VGVYLCGCSVPHIPVGFPLSAARMEKIQDGGKERKPREILVSVGLDSFSCHRHVPVTVPIIYIVYSIPSVFGRATFYIPAG